MAGCEQRVQVRRRADVGALRDTRGVHNLPYAYSPDVFASTTDYLDGYPSDAYADVFGFDDYQSMRSPASRLAPYRGQASAADLVRFRDGPSVLFEDEIPNLYHTPR